MSNLTARQPRRTPHHAMQATTSEGLAQGPYVVAKVGFEVRTSDLPHRRHRTRLQGAHVCVTYHGAITPQYVIILYNMGLTVKRPSQRTYYFIQRRRLVTEGLAKLLV